MGCPFLRAAIVHLTCGFISVSAGIVFWIMLTMYPALKPVGRNSYSEDSSFVAVWQPWLTFLFANKIWCGVWFIITGVVGLSVRSKGSTERCFTAVSALTALIWAPAMVVFNCIFVYCALYGFTMFGISARLDAAVLWVHVFPAVGIFFGFVEFIASIASCFVACCCSPTRSSRALYGQTDMYQLEIVSARL